MLGAAEEPNWVLLHGLGHKLGQVVMPFAHDDVGVRADAFDLERIPFFRHDDSLPL
ncbi:hypothetical protein D3C80_2176800 [compost metagenome]